MKNGFYYEFPIGKVGIVEESGSITAVFFCNEKNNRKKHAKIKNKLDYLDNGFDLVETTLIKKAAGQLGEYFKGKRKKFDLPLAPYGTGFQASVWKALQTIPYGRTCSYKDIALQIGNEKACRAVGMANNRNPIVIIIPCHRVIGKDGSLTGFGGGLDVKQYLLQLEEKNS